MTKPVRSKGDPKGGADAEPLCCLIPASLARRSGITSSTYYTAMYIVYKLLSIANLAFQLFFLHVFLDTNVLLHGFRTFYNFVLKQSKSSLMLYGEI